jgi:hypothetical protein
MKTLRSSSPVATALVLAGLVVVSCPALAQWKWRDPSGAIQYSDRPPPAGTPDQAILSRPAASRNTFKAPAPVAADAASMPASAASSVASGDPELDAKRKKAEEEQAAKQKAEAERVAKAKADNCQRARSYQKSLQDGIRIVRSNASGEREVLDDKGRAEEMARTQEAIQSNCN